MIPQVCPQPVPRLVVRGPQGPRGASIYPGTAAPASSTGSDGDYYLNTVTGDLYYKASGTWSLNGNLKGPAGIRFLGPWISGTSYAEMDAVSHDGHVYLCVSAVAGTTTPDLDAHWVDLGANAALASPMYTTLSQDCNVFATGTDADGTDLSAQLITASPVSVGIQGLTMTNKHEPITSASYIGVPPSQIIAVVDGEVRTDTGGLGSRYAVQGGHIFFASVRATSGVIGDLSGAGEDVTAFRIDDSDDVDFLYGVFIMPGTNSFNLYCKASTAGGDATVPEWTLIDLTELLGAGREKDADWCLANLPYFENTLSIQPQSVKATGRNLFDGETANVVLSNSTGEISITGQAYLSTGFLPCVGGVSYAVSATNNNRQNVYFYDSNRNYLGYDSSGAAVVTPSNARWICVYLSNDNINNPVSDIMLNIGSTALPYEPYREDVLDLSSVGSLRKVSSAADEITKQGKVVRRVKEYTLTEDDVTNLYVGENVDNIKVLLPSDAIGAEYSYGGVLDIKGYSPTDLAWASWDDIQNDNRFAYSTYWNTGTVVRLFVAHGTHADLAAAKAALAGTTIRYQLAEPTTEDLDALPLLTVENGGQIIITEANGLPVPSQIEYPTNLTGTVDTTARQAQDNTRRIDSHETRLDALDEEATTTTVETDTNVFPTGENLSLDSMSLATLGGSGLTATNLLGQKGRGDSVVGWQGTVQATDGEWIYNTAAAQGYTTMSVFFPVVVGHKYFVGMVAKNTIGSGTICTYDIWHRDAAKIGKSHVPVCDLSAGSTDEARYGLVWEVPAGTVFASLQPNVVDDNVISAKEIAIIDLTELRGAGLEPDEAWCMENLPYLENTVSVRDVEVTSCGRNLFDGVMESGSFNTSGVKVTSSGIRTKNQIPVMPETSYTLSSNSDVGGVSRFFYYDAQGNYLGDSGDKNNIYLPTGISITIPEGCALLAFRFFTGVDMTPEDAGNVMLNEGSAALPYEPYVSDKVRLHGPLRRLPNGMEDTRNEDGTVTRRVGGELAAITGTPALTGYRVGTVDTHWADILGWADENGAAILSEGDVLLSHDELSFSVSTSSVETPCFVTVDGKLSINIADAIVGGTDIEAFNAYLNAHPIEVKAYRFATPITEPAAPNTLTVYEGGQVSMTQVYDEAMTYGASGVTFPEPLREITLVADADGAEMVATLAADGLSATVSGATTGDVIRFVGPYLYQLPVPLSTKYTTNRQAIIAEILRINASQARELDEIQTDIAMLILMIAGVTVQ